VTTLPGVLGASVVDGRLTVTLTPEASNAPIVAVLVQQGVGIEEVRRARQSLEDVFLELVAEAVPDSTEGPRAG
jgi:hypothetical protein